MKAELLSAIFLFPLFVAVVPAGIQAQNRPQGEVVITILFDNFTDLDNLQTGWGFAALVETPDHTILFDTGADGEILLANMETLGVDPSRIESVVISHAHGDHTGGMAALLATGLRPKVYLLEAFPPEVTEAFPGMVTPFFTSPGDEIVPGIRTTGVLGEGAIPEQAIFIDTAHGPMVVTGCAHPGPVEMAVRAQELTGETVYGVLGGYHLFRSSPEEVQRTIEAFRAHGISKSGATHCTGPEAMAAFQEAFGEDYVPLGVGRVIRLPLS